MVTGLTPNMDYLLQSTLKTPGFNHQDLGRVHVRTMVQVFNYADEVDDANSEEKEGLVKAPDNNEGASGIDKAESKKKMYPIVTP